MKSEDFDAALRQLNYTSERFAELFDIKAVATVQNWRSGRVDVPGWVQAFVEFLLARPEAKLWFEQRRPHLAKDTIRRRQKRSQSKQVLAEA